MERLTERNKNGLAMASCCAEACEYNYVCEVGGVGECRGMDDIIDRLAAIEDILGDEYDLERLRELVQADRDGRCHIGRCVECAHYDGLAVCEFLGDCGGTNWICGWFEPKKAAEAALKGEQDG